MTIHLLLVGDRITFYFPENLLMKTCSRNQAGELLSAGLLLIFVLSVFLIFLLRISLLDILLDISSGLFELSYSLA